MNLRRAVMALERVEWCHANFVYRASALDVAFWRHLVRR